MKSTTLKQTRSLFTDKVKGVNNTLTDKIIGANNTLTDKVIGANNTLTDKVIGANNTLTDKVRVMGQHMVILGQKIGKLQNHRQRSSLNKRQS